MFRHVLCVYPYRVELGRDGFYPPLGLEIIAAALEPYSEAIDVVDLRREKGGTVEFLRPETDLVCFSVNWEREVDLVRREIRSVPPHILTVVGGRHATEDPEKWLSDCPNVDVLVRGDGEEIVEEIARGLPPSEVAGTSCRSGGRVVHNPVRRLGPVRDDLRPNRGLRRYVYTADIERFPSGFTFDTVSSSRGCPFNCRFCSFSRNPWGQRRSWSARSPESVVRELAEVKADVVAFIDDNFTHDMDRVAAICDLIRARGIRKRFIANARVEVARRPDVLGKMKRAGFSMLLLGIESAKDETLRSMRKGFTIEQARRHFRVLRRTGMFLVGYFIVGNIGETEDDMLRIAPFARELGVDSLALCMLRNERYSGIEELVLQTPGYHIGPDRRVFSDEYSCAYLRRLHRRINRDFYTPGQVFRFLRKGLKNRILTPGMIARLPWFLVHKAIEHSRKARRRGGMPGRQAPSNTKS